MEVKIELIYSKQSAKFLSKYHKKFNEDQVELILLKALKQIFTSQTINIDLKKMKGKYDGYFRVKSNQIRIVFRYTKQNATIDVFIQ